MNTQLAANAALPYPLGNSASAKDSDLLKLGSSDADLQKRRGYVLTGVIAGLVSSDKPIVDLRANTCSRRIVARTVVAVSVRDISREVVVAFEEGDVMRPIILGFLQSQADSHKSVSFEVDGENVVCTGSRQVVLRCGSASITLTRPGKILIEGQYVLTRAKGVNRIKGGSVQIN